MKELIIYILMGSALSHYGCQMVKEKFDVVNTAVTEANTLELDSTFGGHPIQFYIDHKEIPQVCKDLFTSVRQPSDEVDVLWLLDSMFTPHNDARPFYFLTITRTMDEADGAYAEPLGMMAKKFVEERTKEFVNYFRSESLLREKDFEEWAMAVAGEIQISAEGKEREELDRLSNIMRSKCDECFKSQIRIIDAFVERVGHHCP